jgi:hypothetical protein
MKGRAGVHRLARHASLVLALGVSLAGPAPAKAQDCVGFREHTVEAGGTNGVASVFAKDLDGDLDIDVLIASYNDDLIAWYESDLAQTAGGSPPAFTRHVISVNADGATSVFAADLDGDEDCDVLSASRNDDKISWYENIGVSPASFFERVISTSANNATSVHAADVDGDGDLDVLSASFLDGEISWYENRLDEEGQTGSPFLRHIITEEALGAESVFAADVDGDGDTDVLSASVVDDTITWYEQELGVETNDDGEEVEVILFTAHVVSATADGAKVVRAADLDGDGNIDVLSASFEDDKIAWYRNDGATPPAFTEHVISTSADSVASIHVEDLDSDGHLDVLSASRFDDKIAWYRNDGAEPIPGFTEQVISTDAVSADAVFAADLDSDGHIDVLSASSLPGTPSKNDKVAWYRNDGSSPPDVPVFVEQEPISTTAEGAVSVWVADLDDDGDADLLSAGGSDRIAWYENDGATPPGFFRMSISTTASGASAVFSADLDGDGLLDVLSAAAESDTVAWHENRLDSSEPFLEHEISTEVGGASSVYAAGLDGDDDVDVLVAGFDDGTISWFENRLDSSEPFLEHEISTEMGGASSVYAARVDGDDDVDVLAAGFEDDKISWFENLGDSPPTFEEHVVITRPEDDEDVPVAIGPRSVFAADIDGDGDTDLLSASSGDGLIAWYANDGATPPTFTQFAITRSRELAAKVFAMDIDGDGDTDVLSASTGDDTVAWYENDGESPPSFATHFVSVGVGDPASAVAAEISGDGKVDIVAGFLFSVAWFEQGGEACLGFDASGDGRIDGTELAWLARAFGQSVTGDPSEWWSALDYNEDGIVDGMDLAILASGGVWGTTTDTCYYTCR